MKQNVSSSQDVLFCTEFTKVLSEVSKQCKPFDYITRAQRRRLFGQHRPVSQRDIKKFYELEEMEWERYVKSCNLPTKLAALDRLIADNRKQFGANSIFQTVSSRKTTTHSSISALILS